MIERLKEPGGNLGTLSVISAFVLGLVGVVGSVSILVSLVTGSDFWSDTDQDKVIGIAFFVVTALGAVGFYIMDDAPWAGAALSVLGGLALALVVFWAIVPVFIGVGAAVVGVLRARALHGTTPAGTAS